MEIGKILSPLFPNLKTHSLLLQSWKYFFDTILKDTFLL